MQKSQKSRRPALKWTALLALLLLPPMLTACDIGEAEMDFILDLAIDWAFSKNLLTVEGCPPPYDSDDCQIGVNAGMIARWKAGQNKWIGGGMDVFGVDRVPQDVSDALDSAKTVYDQEQSDALAREGASEGDLEKLDQAIGMRPGDWSYQDKKAAVLLSQGDPQGADDAFHHADELVAERIGNGESCLNLQMNKLRNREDALWQQSQLHPENEQIRNQLGKTQDQIWALQNSHESSICR